MIRMMQRVFLVALFGISGFVSRLEAIICFQDEKADSIVQVIRTLKGKIESDPENIGLLLDLGYTYLEIEKFGDADKYFRKCIKLNDTLSEAYNGLGLAQHEKGLGAVIPVEAIKKLFKIDNYSRAEKNFKRAIRFKPEYIDPHYNLGVNYLAKGGNDNYYRSVESMKTVIEKDSLYREVDYMLGIAYQHLKDWDTAEVILKRSIQNGRSVGKVMVKLSEIYLETDRPEDATTSYYNGLVMLRDFKTLNDIYSELETLMSDREKEDFKHLHVQSMGEFFRKFWKRKDPTPTTEENERFLEHFRRIKFCMENFPDIISPYYDDRGKVYVKYGSPDARYISKFSDHEVYENESWTYEKSVHKGLTFDFVKKGLSYRQVLDLSEAAPAGYSMAQRRQMAQELYLERADFTDSYQKFALGNIDHRLIDLNRERNNAQESAPAENYQHNLEGKELHFIYNLSQFRGSDNRSLVEVYLGVSSNDILFLQGFDDLTSPLEYSIVMQDTNYMDIEKRNKRVNLQAVSHEETENKLFLYQENFQLDPGVYYFAVHAENPPANSRGIYKNKFDIRDFSGYSLLISDIQLAKDIFPLDEESMFFKKGLQVVPYPYHLIRRKIPIYIYFEIYNLKFDNTGQTDFTVTYKIDMLEYKRSFLDKTLGAVGRIFSKGKRAGISTTYNIKGVESETKEYFSLDMAKLPAGIAKMTVTVRDNPTSESVSQSIQFRLTD